MRCPECNNRLSVITTRDDDDTTYRYRRCDNCGIKIYTKEVVTTAGNFHIAELDYKLKLKGVK